MQGIEEGEEHREKKQQLLCFFCPNSHFCYLLYPLNPC